MALTKDQIAQLKSLSDNKSVQEIKQSTNIDAFVILYFLALLLRFVVGVRVAVYLTIILWIVDFIILTKAGYRKKWWMLFFICTPVYLWVRATKTTVKITGGYYVLLILYAVTYWMMLMR